MLPPYLGRLRTRHPGIRIRSINANTRTVLRLLLEFRVDVALVEGPVTHPRVEVLPWREDELVVIAPPQHQLFERDRVVPRDLADQPFLVREPGSGTREVMQRALAIHDVRLTNMTRVGGTEAIKHAVAAGLGLAIVSRAAARDQLALNRIAILPIDGLVIPRTLAQLKLRDRPTSNAARELEMLLAEPLEDGRAGEVSGDAGTSARPS